MDDNSLAEWEGVAESSGAPHLMHEAMRGSLLAKPPRSKLEPHYELIRELRQKGRTYREVARLIHERLGLYVALSTLHSFVKVRAKRRQRQQSELPPAESSLSSSPAVDPPPRVATQIFRSQTEDAVCLPRKRTPSAHYAGE
jgi:hypothetical protein